MTDKQETPTFPENEEDLLHHWFGLSGAERMSLIAFADELENSSNLVENNVEKIVTYFFKMNALFQDHCDQVDKIEEGGSISNILKKHKEGKALARNEIDCLVSKIEQEESNTTQELAQLRTEVQKIVEDAVEAFQFQDRTKQRLEQVKIILILMADLLYEMEKKTIPVLTNNHSTPDERQWLEQLIDHMKLGEVRDRFIRTALFAQGHHLFDQLSDHVPEKYKSEDDNEDDIELF